MCLRKVIAAAAVGAAVAVAIAWSLSIRRSTGPYAVIRLWLDEIEPDKITDQYGTPQCSVAWGKIAEHRGPIYLAVVGQPDKVTIRGRTFGRMNLPNAFHTVVYRDHDYAIIIAWATNVNGNAPTGIAISCVPSASVGATTPGSADVLAQQTRPAEPATHAVAP